MCCVSVSNCVVKVHDVVFNTDSPNLVFWVSIVVDITEISAMVAAAGVMIGVVYYILEIRHQARTRQTDLVMKLYSEIGSKEYVEAYRHFFTNLEFKDYEDFRNRYPITTFRASPAYVSYNMYCFFFERVGILLHRKLIDIELVDDLFSLLIKYDWEKAKPIVEGIRKEFNMPQYWEYFEYLYNEMKKRQQQLEQKGVKNG